MIETVLGVFIIVLLLVDICIFFNLKKYIKLHENELVENHIKELLGRVIAMMDISLCVGIIGIIVQI